MYITRQMETQVLEASLNFPVLLLTGARQVGKSSLLNKIKEPEREYVTLDDPQEQLLAKTRPEVFLELHKPPVIIDEIQYAPELFPYIKMQVDQHNQDGMYWLTGSQVFALMRNVQESLAGRVMVLRLQGISQGEEFNENLRIFPSNIEEMLLQQKQSITNNNNNKQSSLTKRIFRGSFPRLLTHEQLQPHNFFAAYVQTWLERDVALISNILDSGTFFQFVQLIATKTGQELNKADLAKVIQVDAKTIDRWLNILETSGLVHLLPSWSNNLGKRLIKRPKIYFLDTGLVCFLAGITSIEQLENSILFGAIYETWIVSEILKRSWNAGMIPRIYYYRDTNQKEIDLIIEHQEKIIPLEIKSALNPQKAFKNFDVLTPIDDKIEFGGVISRDPKLFPLKDKYWMIPDTLL